MFVVSRTRGRFFAVVVLFATFLTSCRRLDDLLVQDPNNVVLGPQEVRELLAAVAGNGTLCAQLENRFVPIPEDDGRGLAVAPGLTPSVGRWAIERCQATAVGDRLFLSVGGRGWTWVDRSQQGFAIRQYVSFDADVHLVGGLDLGFDAKTGLATVWLSPNGAARATVRPGGGLRPKPITLGSELIDLLFHEDVLEQTNVAVAEEGARRFEATMGRGVTLTYAVRTHQFDFTTGFLPKGARPLRPFSAPMWVINEDVALFESGAQILGPIPAGAAVVDVRVSAGTTVDAVGSCQESVLTALRQPRAAAGRAATAPAFRASFSSSSPLQVAPSCRWYLIVNNSGKAPARASVLVAMTAPVAPWRAP